MKLLLIVLFTYLIAMQVLFIEMQEQPQQPAGDLMGILKPWSLGQSIGTTGQTAGNQLLQVMQSTLGRWDQLGQQITGQVSSRLESMENTLHDLAKQFRLNVFNNKNNTTRVTKN